MSEEKANKVVPQHIHRLAHYYHSLIEIWEYWRAIGSQTPTEFSAEMQRAHDEMVEALASETGQGGALHEYYNKLKGKKDETR